MVIRTGELTKEILQNHRICWVGKDSQGTIMVRPYLDDVNDSGLMLHFKRKKTSKNIKKGLKRSKRLLSFLQSIQDS